MAKIGGQKYDKYQSNQTREKNKVRKLKKYLTIHPNNLKMVERLKELEALIK